MRQTAEEFEQTGRQNVSYTSSPFSPKGIIVIMHVNTGLEFSCFLMTLVYIYFKMVSTLIPYSEANN